MVQNIHLKAPGNWINDPNGFIYYKEEYHLFYQYFPYGPRWGTMHWGHAVSRDLTTWEHKGVALFPSQYGDQNGCFSGSAVEHEGKLYLYYTGVRYDEVNPKDVHLCLNEHFTSCQMMLTSENAEEFDNYRDKKMIIEPIADVQIGSSIHTRDPKVWRGKDAWYMILGSTVSNRKGELLFYKSQNLTDWSYVNRADTQKDIGWMWECPDYFETDGVQVLFISPMGMLKDGKAEENHTICIIVNFEEKNCMMEIKNTYQYLDYGLDLYAPQSTVDADGSRVMAAWIRMPQPVDGKWIGMFCLPRIVEVKNEHIYFHVHPNIKKKFTKKITSLQTINNGNYHISLNIENGENINIGGYRITRKDDKIYTDRSEVFPNKPELRVSFQTPEIKDGTHVDIYVDKNLIEVYVNDGEYVISNVVYDLKETLQADVKDEIEVYTLEEDE